MTDKINIIVERDGEFHKFKFEGSDCNYCSLVQGGDTDFGACDICAALGGGHFEKVVTKGER
jgi:hypothetical protein